MTLRRVIQFEPPLRFVACADAITTVSERYSREIQTKEFGCGMENVIATRKSRLFGVINGIDYREWNSETDSDAKPGSICGGHA